VRDDLDVSVKGPPCATAKPKSLMYGPPPGRLLSAENKRDGRFSRQTHRWTPRCFISKEERGMARESLIDICPMR
jgi:hypothetical protein